MRPPALVSTSALSPASLVFEFLNGLSPNTRRAYEKDLRLFAAFAGASSVGGAAESLVRGGSHAAALVALRWRDAMTADGLSPATVNRRLAALRSLVELARTLGLVEWDLRVKGPKRRAYRDVRGPERAAYVAAVAKADLRDAAVLRLLGDRGLRRGSVVDLDVVDFDAKRRTLSVRLKGRRAEPEVLTLATATANALARWIEQRGRFPGPLFPGRDGRLNTDSIRALTMKYGLGNPHGLRHMCGTTTSRVTGGDMTAVQAVLGHAKMETSAIYVNRQRDRAGELAELIAAPETQER